MFMEGFIKMRSNNDNDDDNDNYNINTAVYEIYKTLSMKKSNICFIT